MPPATTERSEKLRFPPDETVWRKYSPHFEFPLSTLASIVLHGAVVLGMVVLSQPWWTAASQPVNIQVVELEAGAPGSGPVGEGGEDDKLKGSPETAPPMPTGPMPMAPTMLTPAPLQPVADKSEPDDDGAGLVSEDLKSLLAQAKAAQEQPKTPAPLPSATLMLKAGSTNPKGQGSATGIKGSGSGGVGNTPGAKGPGGQGGAGSKQAYLANRWRFKFSLENPKLHREKLIKAGLVLAFFKPGGSIDKFTETPKIFVVPDLRQKPVRPTLADAAQYHKSVLWVYPPNPAKVAGVVHELGLPSYLTFQNTLLLLPAEREQQFANAEARYLRLKSLKAEQVAIFEFDFQFRNGESEPVVIKHYMVGEYAP